MALGIDQTVVYIAKMENRWDGTINQSDLEADSPYNTRKYPACRPGPISSVSESAIKAALHPAQTDYLYYVRNVELNDGSHWFYASAAEFEEGKAKYQQWLEQERAKKRARRANQQSMIKLLALDLDGTILNSRGQIPDANRRAIRAAEDAGVLVTIATGRRFRDARPVGSISS